MIKSLKRPITIENGDGPPRYPVKEALGKVRSLIYHGHKVECPCCGETFALFLFSPSQLPLLRTLQVAVQVPGRRSGLRKA
jgi:hypothetical protein